MKHRAIELFPIGDIIEFNRRGLDDNDDPISVRTDFAFRVDEVLLTPLFRDEPKGVQVATISTTLFTREPETKELTEATTPIYFHEGTIGRWHCRHWSPYEDEEGYSFYS